MLLWLVKQSGDISLSRFLRAAAGLFWVGLAGVRTRQGGAARCGGQALMRSRAAGGGEGPGTGRRIVRRPARRQPIRGSGPSPGFVSVAGGAQVRVDLAGDVTLEAADDLGLGLAFFGAAFDVVAGRRV